MRLVCFPPTPLPFSLHHAFRPRWSYTRLSSYCFPAFSFAPHPLRQARLILSSVTYLTNSAVIMVVLSPNFTVLASLSALAVVSMLPATAEAAVLPNTPGRRGQAEGPFSPHRTSNAASSQRHSSGSSHSPATEGQDGATQSNGPIPALPLPGLSKRLQFGAEHEPSVMAAADKVSLVA